jgi:haloalkane dehalogenase
MVHGNPTSSWLYRHVMAALDGVARCVAVDLPGFGRTPAPPGYDFTPRSAAAALAAFVAERDLRDVVLMAQDWGGPIGVGAALAAPERYARLVVLNTWAWPMRGRAAGLWAAAFGGPVARLVAGAVDPAPRVVQLGSRRAIPADELAGYAMPQGRTAAVALAAAVTGANPWLAEVEAGLPALADRPALILWPTADPIFGAGERARWERTLPEHRTVELTGARHFCPEDAPEAIAGAVRRWLPSS